MPLDPEINALLTNFKYDAPADHEAIEHLEKFIQSLGHNLPSDLREILLGGDGIRGELGGGELVIFGADKIIKHYEKWRKFVPDFLIFGIDAIGGLYAFDFRKDNMPIVADEMVGVSYDTARIIGESFKEFLFYLSKGGY